jgi:hypothetical protein
MLESFIHDVCRQASILLDRMNWVEMSVKEWNMLRLLLI